VNVPPITISNFRPKSLKSIPAFRPKRLKIHTLWGGTYLYTWYRGVPPPPELCFAVKHVTLYVLCVTSLVFVWLFLSLRFVVEPLPVCLSNRIKMSKSDIHAPSRHISASREHDVEADMWVDDSAEQQYDVISRCRQAKHDSYWSR